MTRSDDPRLETTVRLRDVAETLVRRKWLILMVAVPVIAAAALYSYSRTPVYRSSTGLLVRPSFSNITTPTRPSDISAQTETNLATSVAVAEVAKSAMGSSLSPQQLLKHVTANMTQGTQVLTITYTAPTRDAAVQGAKAFGDAYLQYRQDRAQEMIKRQSDSLLGQIQQVRQEIAKLTTELKGMSPGPERSDKETNLSLDRTKEASLQSQLVTLQSLTTDPGEVIDPATRPTAPISPRHPFDIALGIVLGLGLGVVVALVRERNSDAVRSVGELEDVLGVPVVAAVPKTPWGTRERAALVVARGQRTPAADAYRRLRTNLLGILDQLEAKTVLVTSANRDEGKTTTVVNLGAAMAEIGRQVVLVSADLRRPTFQRIFPTTDDVGLSQVLTDGISTADVFRETIPNLRIVYSGTLSPFLEPVNLMQTERMKWFLTRCVENADLVVLDGPPVLGAPDTLVLARLVDAVLFVGESWGTRWDDLILARDQINRAGGKMVAGVLNRVELPRRNRRTYGLDRQSRRPHPRLMGNREPGQRPEVAKPDRVPSAEQRAEVEEPDRVPSAEQRAEVEEPDRVPSAEQQSATPGNGSNPALRHEDVARD